MKLGICVGLDCIQEMPRKFQTMRDNGFDSCQLISWSTSHYTPEYFESIKKMLDEYDITVSAFWAGWEGPAVWDLYEGQRTLGLVPLEFRQMRIKNLCDGADFAKQLGITDVVTHMGFIPENPFDPQFIPFCDAVREVAEHLKANGQHLLFEAGQETPNTMLRCFETVGCDNLGVNLDTANLILYGRGNPVDAIDVFGKYIRNLHAKDGFYPNNGHDLGIQVNIGEGIVDFDQIITKLHKIGYDGHITIEHELDSEGEQRNSEILNSKVYLQRIIDRICCK